MRFLKVKSIAVILVIALSCSLLVPVMVSAEEASEAIAVSNKTTIIESTDFDSGKYFESNAAEGSHNVRTEEEVQTEYCGSGYVGREGVDGTKVGNIGWTAANEWVQYTVNVAKSGAYQIDAWVASDAGTPGTVEFSIDGNPAGSAQALKNGWQNYSKVSVGEVNLTAGVHVIKALFPTGSVNFQAFELTRIVAPSLPYRNLKENLDKEYKIVALGDSIPAYYGIGEAQGCVSQLSALLKTNNVKNKTINLAKSGSTTSDVLKLLATDKAKEALTGVDVVTLSIGANNILSPLLSYIWALTAMVNQKHYAETESPAIGNFYFSLNQGASFQYDITGSNSSSVSTATLEKAFAEVMTTENMAVIEYALNAFAVELQTIIETIKTIAPEADIYISTVYNPVDKNLEMYKQVGQIINSVNTIIIAGALEDNLYRVVDVASAFAASERNLTGFDIVRRMYDIHPNRFGHVEIAKLYFNAMTGSYADPILEIPTEVPVVEVEVEVPVVEVEVEA